MKVGRKRSGVEDVRQARRGSFVGMLGRDNELTDLDGALSDALAGRCQVKLVAGEPGIGKTTLVRALAELADPSDARVSRGRCWESGGAPAFWPWLEVLRELADPGAEPAAELLSLLSDGDHLAQSSPPADTQAARFRMFEAAARFLQEASSHRAQPSSSCVSSPERYTTRDGLGGLSAEPRLETAGSLNLESITDPEGLVASCGLIRTTPGISGFAQPMGCCAPRRHTPQVGIGCLGRPTREPRRAWAVQEGRNQ